MTQDLLTVDSAAAALQLHPKTVLRFIREGRLKATKVGRAFRIARREVEALAGLGEPEARTGLAARATVVVDIDDLTIDEAQRAITLLQASVSGPKARPIQVETAYDRVARSLKLVIIAGPGDAGALLTLLSNFTDA